MISRWLLPAAYISYWRSLSRIMRVMLVPRGGGSSATPLGPDRSSVSGNFADFAVHIAENKARWAWRVFDYYYYYPTFYSLVCIP